MLTAVADRDFLFEPVELEQLSLFAHIVDTKTTGVLVKNDTDRSIILPQNRHLGHLQELGTEQGLTATAFTATEDLDFISMAERLPQQSSCPGWFTKAITALRAAYSVVSITSPSPLQASLIHDTPDMQAFAVLSPLPTPATTPSPTPEIVLPNGIMIYGTPDSETVHKLSGVMESFPELWEDSGQFVNLPQDEWMKIPLRTDWESCLPAKGAWVYPLGLGD